MPKKTVSDRINDLGKSYPRGWKSELARHCEVKSPSVTDWITGRTQNIEAKHLFKIADFFKVSPNWLQFGTGPETSEGNTPNLEQLRITPPAPSLRSSLERMADTLTHMPTQDRQVFASLLAKLCTDPADHRTIDQLLFAAECAKETPPGQGFAQTSSN